MRRARLQIAALTLLLLAGACGYQLASRSSLPGEARSAYVPVFRNLTPEVGVEGWFTDAFRLELQRRGLEGGEASDLVALGEIEELTTPSWLETLTRSEVDGRVAEASHKALYRVSAAVTVKLFRGGEEVASTRVVGSEEHSPGRSDVANPSASAELYARTEAQRALALRRLASSLMARAVENLTTRW